MKHKELKELTDAELILKEKSFKKGLFDLNFQKEFGRVEKPGQFRNLRKTIARIQTVLSERERQNHDTKNK